jgi:hypothetical protein
MRGGRIEGIYIDNITMENPLAAVTFNEYYYYGVLSAPAEELFDKGRRDINPLTPTIKNVNITNIKATGVKGVGIYMLGLPEAPIENVRMENLSFEIEGSERGVGAVAALEREDSKGEGIFLENVKDVVIERVDIKCPLEKYVFKNTSGVKINGEDF